jgi:hypothetical protein
LGYFNGTQLAKFGTLIDRASSIYLNVKLKALDSVIFLLVISFYKNSGS